MEKYARHAQSEEELIKNGYVVIRAKLSIHPRNYKAEEFCQGQLPVIFERNNSSYKIERSSRYEAGIQLNDFWQTDYVNNENAVKLSQDILDSARSTDYATYKQLEKGLDFLLWFDNGDGASLGIEPFSQDWPLPQRIETLKLQLVK